MTHENYAIETDALPSMGHTRAEAVGRTGRLARIVQADEVEDVDISTVFCAIPFCDEPLLCYQSLCSGGPLDGECQRYQTRAAAVTGHADLVARAKRETTRSVEVIAARWQGDPGQAKEAARLDVAWLLAEVGRLRAEASRWEQAWREDTGNDGPTEVAPTCPITGLPCASPICRDMGCDLVTDLEPDREAADRLRAMNHRPGDGSMTMGERLP